MEYFVGIDVSLATSAVCVIDGRGEVVREAKVASEPAPVLWTLGWVTRP